MSRITIQKHFREQRDFRIPTQVLLSSIIFFILASCVPKHPVEFRSIKNIAIDTDSLGQPLLTGQAVLFNPNKQRMRLKEIKLEVLVDGKKAANVDQKPDLEIPAASEFTVTVQAQLSLKDFGLQDALMGFFGGKKYNVQYVGYVRVKVHGFTVKVPVDFKDQLNLKM